MGSIPLGSASNLKHLGCFQPRSLKRTLVNSGERLRNLLPAFLPELDAEIAKRAMADHSTATNPRPMSATLYLELLQNNR